MNKKILISLSLSTGALLLAAQIYSTRSDCVLSDGTAGTIFELEMGDRSCDGHCISKSRNICSQLSAKQITDAYKVGEAKAGVPFADVVAEEYEDSSLPMEKLKKLRESGIATWKFEDEEFAQPGEVLESVGLNQDTYSEIYLQLVKLGNAEFKYETLKGKSLYIGGYGLFSQ